MTMINLWWDCELKREDGWGRFAQLVASSLVPWFEGWIALSRHGMRCKLGSCSAGRDEM